MKIDESIEILKEMKENCIDKGKTYYEDDKRVKKSQAIETVLKKIDKQNKLINQMKKFILDQKIMCEFLDTTNESDIYVEDKISKLNSVIDLMAEQLTTDYHSKEWVKQYFEKKVE